MAYMSSQWLGETPRPVVEVTHAARVLGYPTILNSGAKQSCVMAPGEYHPWSEQVANYASLRSVVEYRAKKDTNFRFSNGSRLSLDRGESIYLIDTSLHGNCTYLYEETEFVASCKKVTSRMRLIYSEGQPFYDQFIQVPCSFSKGWVWVKVDDTLFDVPGVKEGLIEGDKKAARE